MTAPQYARLASKVLAREDHAERPVESSVRAEAIATLERAIAAKARGRRWNRGAVAVLAVAAVAILGVGATHLALRPKTSGVQASVVQASAAVPAVSAAVVVHPSGEGANVVGANAVAVDSGQALEPGARVIALPHGRALLAFSSGTQVNVEEGGDVSIVEAGAAQVLALRSGALRADVAKLKTGERFVIRTSDAEVEVHGTSFRLSTATPNADCGDGTTTRVSVYEGVVTVRRGALEVRVAAGESWPQNCAEAAKTANPGTHAQIAAGASPSKPPSTPVVEPAAAPATKEPVVPSSLVEQNDAFAEAASMKRRGDLKGAVERFGAFVATYPDSALAESAAAQRMKLLESLDRRRAVTAARDYLAHYPRGFAKADAEAILAEEP